MNVGQMHLFMYCVHVRYLITLLPNYQERRRKRKQMKVNPCHAFEFFENYMIAIFRHRRAMQHNLLQVFRIKFSLTPDRDGTRCGIFARHGENRQMPQKDKRDSKHGAGECWRERCMYHPQSSSES